MFGFWAGGVPGCQWAAKGIVDQKPCWSSEIAALSPSARDHLGLKPKPESPPGSSQPLWHRSPGLVGAEQNRDAAGEATIALRACGRARARPRWQGISLLNKADSVSHPSLPTSLLHRVFAQGARPALCCGTQGAGCPQGARRVPAAPLRPAGSSRLVGGRTWTGISGNSGRNSDPPLSPNLAHFTLRKTQAGQLLFACASSFWVSFWLL